jgi:hypothetical protein
MIRVLFELLVDSATAFGACMVFVFGYQILSFGRIWNCVNIVHYIMEGRGRLVCMSIHPSMTQATNE